MTRRRDPFTMALESLRRRAEGGVFAPGMPVVIIEEARRLRLSTTPVREALAWLCGHGLIERAPTGGYVAPRLEPAPVRDRFVFRLHCLVLSLDGADPSHGRGRSLNGSDRSSLQAVDHMQRLVQGTGNGALVAAYDQVCSQLAQLAGAERRLFRDYEAEAEALSRLFLGSSRPALREALVAYHQRRIDAAPLLILDADARRDPPGPVE